MIKEFKTLALKFEIDGEITRREWGREKTFTQRNLAFDCSPFALHWSNIKTPYADSTAIQKGQDSQAWGGVCCNVKFMYYEKCLFKLQRMVNKRRKEYHE